MSYSDVANAGKAHIRLTAIILVISLVIFLALIWIWSTFPMPRGAEIWFGILFIGSLYVACFAGVIIFSYVTGLPIDYQ